MLACFLIAKLGIYLNLNCLAYFRRIYLYKKTGWESL